MEEGFDEDFVRAAVVTEPSHRERERRPGPWRRWRNRRRAARLRRPLEKPARVRGARFSGGGGRTAGNLVVAVVVLVGALGVAFWTRSPHGGSSRTPVPATATGGPAVVPSVSPSDPFAGSPAAAYATGEAGILAPDATAIGRFPAAQVKAAYAATRRLVVAAGLDRATLLGGAPDAFAAALAPHDRTYFRAHLAAAGNKSTRYEVVTMLPRSAELVGSAIKVHGTMSATEAVHWGRHYLDVKVDYLFVYAIQPPGKPVELERLVVRLTGTNSYSADTPSVLRYWGVSPTPASCDANDGYIHPEYASSFATSPASGPPVDPYDQSRREPSDGRCRVSEPT